MKKTNGSYFVAGTLVVTTLELSCIEDIRPGDYVYAKDEVTGEQEYMPVLETYEREVTETYTVTIDGETIETTAEHPFFTVDNGWTCAKDLNAGDNVELSDGSSGEVETVEKNELDEPIIVYNFNVMDYHTYYVSDSEVLVHNTCKNPMTGTNNKASDVFDGNGTANKSGTSSVTKPYTNSRPSFRKGVVEEVWENAKGPDGFVRDPNAGDIINWNPGESRKGVWDMGHLPEAKYSDMHDAYMNGELSKKEFVDWYNDPSNYRPELPSNNRSHKYE